MTDEYGFPENPRGQDKEWAPFVLYMIERRYRNETELRQAEARLRVYLEQNGWKVDSDRGHVVFEKLPWYREALRSRIVGPETKSTDVIAFSKRGPSSSPILVEIINTPLFSRLEIRPSELDCNLFSDIEKLLQQKQ